MRNSDKKLIALLCSCVAVLIVAIILAAGVYNSDDPVIVGGVEYIPGTTSAATVASAVNTTEQTTVTVPQSTASPQTETQTAAPVTTTQTQPAVNVSALSDGEILNILTEAVNKTKAYQGEVSVKHTESFDANVTECTGGSLVVTAANALVGMVLDPTDETLSFSGGSAVNSDGETVAILLPQAGNFSLSADGISSIGISVSGDETVISAALVSESVGMTEKPRHNASGVGFLDVSELDLSILEITSANIVYTGSTIEVHIRPDGYVSYAKYTIPMHIEGSAKSGPISGSAVFDGKQTEIWQFLW